jgi:hypothetical protein
LGDFFCIFDIGLNPMKQYISIIFLLLSILFTLSHCKKKTEEVIPEKIPYDCVLKSNGYATFEYDALGRIKQIIYHSPLFDYIENPSYTYLDKLVIVQSKELIHGDTFFVQSNYYLNKIHLADSVVHSVFINQKFNHTYKDYYRLDDSGYVIEYLKLFINNTNKIDTTYHSKSIIENGNTVFSNVLKDSQAPYTIKTKYLDSLNVIDQFEKINFKRSSKNLKYYSEASFAWNAYSLNTYVWDKYGNVIQKINKRDGITEMFTWDCKYK